MPRLAVLLLAAGLFVLSACDGDSGGFATPTPSVTDAMPVASPTAPGSSGPPPEDTPITDTTAPAEFDGTRGRWEGTGSGGGTGILVDVNTGRHDGFDRIVFDFGGALPGYSVEQFAQPVTEPGIEPFSECGSGRPVEIAGASFLVVRFSPAAAHDVDTGEPAFELRELTPGLPMLLEAQSTCDFEGEVTWVVGLSEETDFRVFELDVTIGLLVDVRHP